MLPLSSKKASLDKEVFKNYRPVSNLNFISNILERVIVIQLQTHLDEASLMTAFQPAYRKHHSTEIALLNIHNDILLNIAKGSVTALTLLDLSAAYDIIDQTILMDRFNVYYGISELAIGWLKSYLSGRTHSVKVYVVHSHILLRSSMEFPRALSLDQFCSLSTLTQSAQSFIPTVASTITFTLMTCSYT